MASRITRTAEINQLLVKALERIRDYDTTPCRYDGLCGRNCGHDSCWETRHKSEIARDVLEEISRES